MPDISAEPYSDVELDRLRKLAMSRGIGYVEKRLIATVDDLSGRLDGAVRAVIYLRDAGSIEQAEAESLLDVLLGEDDD